MHVEVVNQGFNFVYESDPFTRLCWGRPNPWTALSLQRGQVVVMVGDVLGIATRP